MLGLPYLPSGVLAASCALAPAAWADAISTVSAHPTAERSIEQGAEAALIAAKGHVATPAWWMPLSLQSELTAEPDLAQPQALESRLLDPETLRALTLREQTPQTQLGALLSIDGRPAPTRLPAGLREQTPAGLGVSTYGGTGGGPQMTAQVLPGNAPARASDGTPAQGGVKLRRDYYTGIRASPRNDWIVIALWLQAVLIAAMVLSGALHCLVRERHRPRAF